MHPVARPGSHSWGRPMSRLSSHGLRPLIVGLVLTAMIIFSESVAAHRPVFPGGRGASPETAVRIADPAVSHVVYAELTPEQPYVWFRFDNELPRRIPLQLGTPAGVDRGDRDGADPVVLLFHPDASASLHPQPTVPAEGNTNGVTVIELRGAAEFFDEPVTGTKSWILVDTEVLLPEAGTYYGVVYDQSERGVGDSPSIRGLPDRAVSSALVGVSRPIRCFLLERLGGRTWRPKFREQHGPVQNRTGRRRTCCPKTWTTR